MSEELKYKVGDEVLVKGVIIGLREPDETVYVYTTRFDNDYCSTAWVDNITESSIVCAADEFVKGEANQKTYEQGLNDAWEMAQLLSKCTLDGGLTPDEVHAIYNSAHSGYIISNYSAKEAIDKYNAWKEKQRFKMGDVVEYVCAGETKRAVFYSETDGGYWVLCTDSQAPQNLPKSIFKLRKVGNYALDINSVLKYVDKEVPV